MPARRFLAVFLTTVLVSATAFAAEPSGALARAAERGDQALVRSLIQQGADVNAPGVDGSTPLHRAVFADHLDVASLLRQGRREGDGDGSLRRDAARARLPSTATRR